MSLELASITCTRQIKLKIYLSLLFQLSKVFHKMAWIESCLRNSKDYQRIGLWKIIQHPDKVSKPASPEGKSETLYLKQDFLQLTMTFIFQLHNRLHELIFGLFNDFVPRPPFISFAYMYSKHQSAGCLFLQLTRVYRQLHVLFWQKVSLQYVQPRVVWLENKRSFRERYSALIYLTAIALTFWSST